jgi:hypothetical protein
VGKAAVVTVVAGMVVGSSAKSFVPPPQAVTISATTTATRIGRIMNLSIALHNPPTDHTAVAANRYSR